MKKLRLTYPGQEYHDPMYKQLQHYEDLLERGELVNLPCKVGELYYAVGMYGCALAHTKGEPQKQIANHCTSINGACWRCKYPYPTISENVCSEIEIGSEGIRVEGYTPDEIFTDKGKAEAKLKELENKAWKTINKINL